MTPIPRRPISWNIADRSPGDITFNAAELLGTPPRHGWGDATGAGVRVCIVDSGIDRSHPLVGAVVAQHAVVDGKVVPEPVGDRCGHGTACAGIVREVAPGVELHSLRVLDGYTGTGAALVTGLRWAVDQGFDVINTSLSTDRPEFITPLAEIVDDAYFSRTAIIAAAHNQPVVSYPWRFGSVVSVGSHHESDPGLVLLNPRPPVEFFAMGHNVPVAWPDRRRARVSGNSFAAARVSGLCAQVLSRHPGLTIFQLKTVLHRAAANTAPADVQPTRSPSGGHNAASLGST